MTINYRQARQADLSPAQDLITASINELTVRHGFGAIASARPPVFQAQSLADDPAGFWIAEQDGRLVGSTFSWVCGDLWFLAELFVDPALQGKGVGGELLRRVFAQADAAGAKTRALITFAFNTVSQSLYMREGMFPRLPLHMMTGERATLAAALTPTALRSERIESVDADRDGLTRLDLGALGVSREKHRRMLARDPSLSGYLFFRDSDCVGYAWIADSGHVGPLAAAAREDMRDVFAAALALAAQGASKRVSALVPGACETALALATRCGMRIALPMALASNRDFGDWRRYLPRNPLFM
ncbi:MAG TPA: GNAT family N-acetyltransferase [Rhodoblastus sp.]|nr:GNAT family N-acetyltransferase [Rhodoblastus sp.]